MSIIGIDTGKDSTKYVCAYGSGMFKSKLCSSRELKTDNGQENFIIEFRGKKYFGDELADREGHIPINYKDASKLHETTLINTLTALYIIGGAQFKIVIGSPISKRTEEEKAALSQMMVGTHRIAVNGQWRTIQILDCMVSPEGAAGFHPYAKLGLVQGLDFGSTTINYFYIDNRDGKRKFVDKKSDTFEFDNVITDYEGIMEAIQSQLANKFERNNTTMLMGGLAEQFFPYAKRYYPKSFVVDEPLMATAKGFYQIARTVYG